MKKFFFLLFALVIAVAPGSAVTPATSPAPSGVIPSKLVPVGFSEVRIDDDFWNPVLQRHRDVTLNVCIDQIENKTGRMRNFENAGRRSGEHSGIFFDDSDVYKALEGMAYSLQLHPDPVLEAKCDEWIDKFAAAQLEDGYLYTFYTLKGLDGRWTDMDKHEMYCAGHMTEAAIAYYRATGKRKFLDVAIRMVDYMMTVFGPLKRDWVPGHEEIELALVKLYEVTGDGRYLDFAHWLLEERGHGKFRREGPSVPAYIQDDVPVSEITDICGHAVRAMYLYCGMADVAAHTGNQAYINALTRVWSDVVERNMYITGGIGSSAHNEGFTEDYDLPNREAYCETCASVGLILWNWRMNKFTADAKYVDVMERALYNGALDGISLGGDRFFYVNPLESDGTHHRQEWYGCACCPSQICRFLPSIGNYIYGRSDDAVYVNMFIGSEGAGLKIQTQYPYDGKVVITVKDPIDGQIRVRIPAWCSDYSVNMGKKSHTFRLDKGYLCLSAKWKKGDRIEIDLDMPIKAVEADPRVAADKGKRAVCRGPLVYCLEEIDNAASYDTPIGTNTSFELCTAQENATDDVLSGVPRIKDNAGHIYIPYFCWDNRGASRMKVWNEFRDNPPAQPRVSAQNFPIAVQFSPVPSGEGWRSREQPLTDLAGKETVRNFIEHGFTHISTSSHNKDNSGYLDYAQDLGMKIDYLTSGLEQFHRDLPPENSVLTDEYRQSIPSRVENSLCALKNIRNPYCVFPFMDEPFHSDTTAFDYREPVCRAFAAQYGYPMPQSWAQARKDPRKYMDFINFQSSLFPRAWKEIYREVKKYDPRPIVTMTLDSHNTQGGGTGSDAKMAIDDIYHWGGDYADMFIYDIYPYTSLDYRFGESGLVYKPRMSQLHWTLAQLRNLSSSYGKKMGFWVGTFNSAWFKFYMDEHRRSQYWMERELVYTAIGGGADYIITGFKVPEDARHWENLGEGLNILQKEGGALLATKRPQGKACFLFPRTQHVLQDREYFNVALTFELCTRAFGEMDIIHEEQITDDTLLGYDILVLADVEILPEAVSCRIRDFVKKGGTVIADCVPQTDEALGPSGTLRRVFGVKSADTYRVGQRYQWVPYAGGGHWAFADKGQWEKPSKVFDAADGFRIVSPRHCTVSDARVLSKMKSGEPLLMEKNYGKGKAILLGFCIQDTYLQTYLDENSDGRDALQDLVHDVFARTGVIPGVYSSNPDVEVALRTGPDGAFAMIINHEAEHPMAEITLNSLGFKPGKVIDVESGRELKFKKTDSGISLAVCPDLNSKGSITRLLKIIP